MRRVTCCKLSMSLCRITSLCQALCYVMGFNGEDKQTCAWIDGVYSLLQEKHVNLKNVNVYVSRIS